MKKRALTILESTESPWTTDELRALATLRNSAHGKALSKALTLYRNQDRALLMSPETDYARTQFVRGRLAFLEDLVLLLEQDASAKYESERKRSAPRDSEPE